MPEPLCPAFADRLCEAVRKKGSASVVGIDPRWESLPDEIRAQSLRDGRSGLSAAAAAYEVFSARIIDVVADLVPAVKFQSAFFEAAGPEGLTALHRAMSLAKDAGLVVLLDAKRSDIGSTAQAYAQAYLGEESFGGQSVRAWPSDALTVNPYLGEEGLDPFVRAASAGATGVFVLVRTSNPGAGEIQELTEAGRSVHERIADWVEATNLRAAPRSRFGPVGAVVGATAPAQLAKLRRRMPHAILLIPGYGAQGGGAADVAPAFAEDGLGAVINNSRGIIFAYSQEGYAGIPWPDAVRRAAQAMNADLAAATPVGRHRTR